MRDKTRISRRRVVQTIGGTALTVSLAGCTGDDTDAETGSDTDPVSVDVGAGENGIQFAPAEIEIPPGTTVTWEWTGEGGSHNVVHDVEAPEFESELAEQAGTTFEHIFDTAGTYEYNCEPHVELGMVGTVEVTE